MQSISLATRHALLTSVTFHLMPSPSLSAMEEFQDFLDALALSLIGKRYETLDGIEPPSGPRFKEPKWQALGSEIIAWLRRAM